MYELNSDDPWYQALEEKYGYEFVVEAGYFMELRPWIGEKYTDHAHLPKNDFVIQYSGAFHPFHDGHLEVVYKAIDAMVDRLGVTHGTVVIHVDHSDYRTSKGSYDEAKFHTALLRLYDLFPYRSFELVIVYEDYMENGCSRNFIRLYKELYDTNHMVFFVSGGDRANYALSFKDEGCCMIVGRSSHPNFEKYRYLESGNIWFIEGNNLTSSTSIRNACID